MNYYNTNLEAANDSGDSLLPGSWRVSQKASRKNKNSTASSSKKSKISKSNNCLDSFFSQSSDVQKLMVEGENANNVVTTLSRALIKGDKFRITIFFQKGIQDMTSGFKKTWVMTIISLKDLSEEIDVYCPQWMVTCFLERNENNEIMPDKLDKTKIDQAFLEI